MLATARHATALALVGALLVGGASPVFAADRTSDNSRIDFTLANVAPFVPTLLPATIAAAPAPAPLADAAQTRPIEMAIPRSGSSTTSLRRTMYVSFAGLQIMDALSTSKALAAGGTEANPAMTGVVKNKAAFYGIKAATALSTVFLSERIAKNHPKRAMILMAVLNTAYVGIVAHNYKVARTR